MDRHADMSSDTRVDNTKIKRTAALVISAAEPAPPPPAATASAGAPPVIGVPSGGVELRGSGDECAGLEAVPPWRAGRVADPDGACLDTGGRVRCVRHDAATGTRQKALEPAEPSGHPIEPASQGIEIEVICTVGTGSAWGPALIPARAADAATGRGGPAARAE